MNDTYNARPGEWTTTLHTANCVSTIEEKQRPGLPLSKEVVLVSEIQTLSIADIDPARIKIEKTASHEASLVCNEMNPNLEFDQTDIGHTPAMIEA